jgi:hypothetical protein
MLQKVQPVIQTAHGRRIFPNTLFFWDTSLGPDGQHKLTLASALPSERNLAAFFG